MASETSPKAIAVDKSDDDPERIIESLEVDSSEGNGSALDQLLSTKSVTASVFNFHEENGRTYHGYRAGSYHFPNDATEIERLEFQHIMIHHAIGEKLYYAPLRPKPKHILDIGTGTGTWAMEMGDLFPDTVIEATDLSPIQPTAVSDNVHFLIDDAEQADWGVDPDHYDYIHMRVMLGCFKSMKSVIEQAYRHIVPGGYMESQELTHLPFCDDGTMKADWPFLEWSTLMDEVSTTAERPLDIAHHLKGWYEDAGFVDVQERVFWGPIGTWPKDHDLKALGRWWQENLLMGLQGFSLGYLSRVLRWTAEEVEVYLVNVRRSLSDRSVHAYHKVHVVTGRKPFPHEIDRSKSATGSPSGRKTRRRTAEEGRKVGSPGPVPE